MSKIKYESRKCSDEIYKAMISVSVIIYPYEDNSNQLHQ